MTNLDWAIVAGLNLLVFGYAAWRARQTKTGEEWFVGGRALPFWVVGLSMFATSADGGEYVSVNGQTYQYGLALIAGLMLGALVGAIVSSFWVAPRMYRAGHFTNTEYLEPRYGLAARVISVFVQLQYRTSVIATIAVSLQLVLREVMGLSPAMAWTLVVALAVCTAAYAAWGGLKTVAATDVLLSAIMIIGMAVLWVVVWRAVGGWEGVQEILQEKVGEHPAARGGQTRPDLLHPVVVVLGMVCVVTGYFVSNHAQTMKMFGVRSLWDMKMAALMAGTLIGLGLLFGGAVGALGRELHPALERADTIYPTLLKTLLAPGLLGLVLAGLLAASISTFEGISAAMAALFTRDVYARLLKRDAPESHYLTVTRLATVAVVLGSFLYVPFILAGTTMVDFFINITSVFVTPLTVVYLLGVFTRVNRRSAMVGLMVGAGFGIARMIWSDALPMWVSDKFVAYLWSAAITATAMLAATWGWGWETADAISDETLPEVNESPFEGRIPGWARPELWAAVLLAGVLLFVGLVLW